MLPDVLTFSLRAVLVLLFLPCSALDKLMNFKEAKAQASEGWRAGASVLVCFGLTVEILMPLGILSGLCDRFAAFVLAGYCGVTALLWKQFWITGDFWIGGKGRSLYWDFLKNFALAAGFLLLTFGTGPVDVAKFVHHPFASSHPYG